MEFESMVKLSRLRTGSSVSCGSSVALFPSGLPFGFPLSLFRFFLAEVLLVVVVLDFPDMVAFLVATNSGFVECLVDLVFCLKFLVCRRFRSLKKTR